MKKALLFLMLLLTGLMTNMQTAHAQGAQEPLLRFACLSDIHNELSMISPTDPANIRLRTALLTALDSISRDNAQLIVLGGDYTSDCTIAETNWLQHRKLLAEAVEKAITPDADGRRPAIYCNGNHDYEVANFDNIPKPYNAGDYYTFPMKEQTGKLYANECFYEEAPNGALGTMKLLAAYHYVIAGFDFVVLNAGKYFFKSAWDYQYSMESVEWVDRKLDEIYASDPNKTVFFISHLPLDGSKGATVGKTLLSSAASTQALRAALLKHPNLINIYGHDHSSKSNNSFYETSLSQRITHYDSNGNIYEPEEEEDPVRPTTLEVTLKNLSNGKYLGFDSYNLNVIDEPNRFTVSNSTAVSGALAFFGDNAPTNNNGYIYCGSNGRFSGNSELLAASSVLLYEAGKADAEGNFTATRAEWPEFGKNYVLVNLCSKGGYYALTNEPYSAGTNSQRMVGLKVSDDKPADQLTFSTPTVVWTVNDFNNGEVSGGGEEEEPQTDVFYIQDQDGNYFDYKDNINMCIIGPDASVSQGFRISKSTATAAPWANSKSVQLLSLCSADGRYLYCGSNGKFSGNTQASNTGTCLWLYEVEGDKAVRTDEPTSGKQYLIVGYKNGTYYQMLNTNNGGTTNDDLREDSEALEVTELTDEMTFNGNTAALWTLTAVPDEPGTEPEEPGEPSFMSIFMGSMRYNSLDTNATPGVEDSPIIQGLIVTVYEDKVVFTVKNYGETGQLQGSAVSTFLTNPLPDYVVKRTVTCTGGNGEPPLNSFCHTEADPKENSYVSALSRIVLTFDEDGDQPASADAAKTIVVTDADGNQITTGTAEMGAAKGATEKDVVITFADVVDKPGKYTVIFPEAFVYSTLRPEAYNPAFTITYFVEEATLPLGEPISDLTQLSNEKAYLLYNPIDIVYAVYNPDHAPKIWAANQKGSTSFSASVPAIDVTDPGSSWMAIQKDGNFYLYNLGAQMYLTTPDYQGTAVPAVFSVNPTELTVENRSSDGYFAFTSVPDNYLSYFCSASQFSDRFMTNWSSDDHGCAWVLIENPNVEADLEVINTIITGIDHATMVKEGIIYSLSGTRMNGNAALLPKGVYIINGRKVVNK